MYHGRVVPGLPAAPAPRVRDGDHRSPRAHRPLRLARRGGALRPGRRAVAHRGRRHRALRDVPAARARARPTRSSSSRIWLNLPGEDKLVPPHFAMLWDRDIPRCRFTDDAGRRRRSRSSPGSSTASARRRRRRARGRRDRTPTSPSGRCSLPPGARWTVPPAANPESVRTLYFFRGSSLRVAGEKLDAHAAVVVRERRRGPARGRRRRVRAAAAPGAAHRRAGRAVRPVRDEHARRDPAGDPGLSAHAVRRLAVARGRSGPPERTRGASRGTPDGRVERVEDP